MNTRPRIRHSESRTRSLPGARAARGVGLIEVMVAMVILAFGLLGIAAMQATTLRNSQSALQRSQAVVLTYAMLDRMRANGGVAAKGGYDLSMCEAPGAGTLVDDDRTAWIANIKNTLGPTACGQISGCGTPTCRITVRWDDSRGTGGGTAQSLVTETRL